MFKCYDCVSGEIIESEDKQKLLEEMNDRFIHYNGLRREDYKRIKVSFYSINKVYYLVEIK